jgi:hypothetical protein
MSSYTIASRFYITLLRSSKKWCAAQGIPQIDPREIGFAFHGAGAEIAEKGNF